MTMSDETTEFRNAVREGYDALADAYTEGRSHDSPGVEMVETFADELSAGSRVLDAGCGAGEPVAARLANRHRVVGLDISGEQLRLATERGVDAALCQGDLAALPFRDDAFDALVALYSVIHVPREQHAAVYEEFHRVLRPGSRALVVSGTSDWEGENEDWLDEGAAMRWSIHGPEATRRLLHDAGFEIEAETTVDDELGGAFTWYRVRAYTSP